MSGAFPAFGFGDATFALLISGRTVYEYAGLTMEVVEKLRALARELQAAQAPSDVPIVVAPGRDLSADVAPREGPIYARLAIGGLVAMADADTGEPVGPLSLAELRARARKSVIPPSFWNDVARIVESEAKGLGISPAELRASAASTGHATLLDGISLDARELRDGPDRLFLVASGRLPAADLVWGEIEIPPSDDDDTQVDDDRDRLFVGQARGQEPHRRGVRGERIAHATYTGTGAVLVDLDALERRKLAASPEGGLFLVPYYD